MIVKSHKIKMKTIQLNSNNMKFIYIPEMGTSSVKLKPKIFGQIMKTKQLMI